MENESWRTDCDYEFHSLQLAVIKEVSRKIDALALFFATLFVVQFILLMFILK